MDISAYQHMNIRMSTRGKRPLRNLTPSDKVRAIQRIHNGETKASVSRDIGVPESTLRGWCKNEQKLRFMCRQLSGSDQLGSLPSLDASSLPEKRNRFESHIKTPQFPGSTGFEEFPFNRLPLSSLHYSTNGSNAILEKIAFNEIMKKHVLPPVEGGIQKKLNIPLPNTVPTAAIGTMPLGTDFAQLSIMQNLNLLSLLNPGLSGVGAPQNYNTGNGGEGENGKEKVALAPLHITADDMIKDSPQRNSNGNSNNNSNNNNNNNNTNNINNDNSYNGSNNAISLSVKDWAKDPVDNISVMDNVINGVASGGDGENSIHNNNKCNSNDTNNNTVNDKHLVQSNAAAENIEPLNFLSPLPLALLQIPNVANTTTTATADAMDTENANAVLLEWYKVFNASLNFLALATAAAALQPANNSIQSLPSLPCGIVNSNNNHNAIVNGNQRKEEPDSTEENILYKELTKSAAQQQFETLAKNSGNVINSDTSNDSYLESEPEDLSVRSAATSKLSSPVNSCSQSPLPIKSSSSCSPHSLVSDGEQ